MTIERLKHFGGYGPQDSATGRPVWELVARQHGVVTRGQLLDLGYGAGAVRHRLATCRFRRIRPGVYAVGRSQLTLRGQWIAAVLSCGPSAALSHDSAAALFRIRPPSRGEIHVAVAASVGRRRPGIVIHRRADLAVTQRHGIPVTSPVFTLVDLATGLTRAELESAINAADKHGLTDPEALRAALRRFSGRPGVAKLRDILDLRTFTLTDSALERYFLPIARRVGLSRPRTGEIVNGYKVDFYWPELGLVVETDGLRYHRTPAQQAKDRVRDQAHAAAGLTTLRFTHAQVRFEPAHVEETLAAVVRRLLCASVSWQTAPIRR